jgi:hypothetical protein
VGFFRCVRSLTNVRHDVKSVPGLLVNQKKKKKIFDVKCKKRILAEQLYTHQMSATSCVCPIPSFAWLCNFTHPISSELHANPKYLF